MSGPPTPKPACPSCGTEVPPDAPQGYCLKCLFDLGTAEPDSVADAATDQSEVGIRNSETSRRSLGDYELLEEIARGGMGIVYKARQKSLGRVVAVKMLLFGQHADKEQAQRFRAEAALAASLQHPNIVAIHEVNAYEGQPFFVMDFIDGQNLARLSAECDARNAEWLRRAAGYVKVVAEAIHYAHERGILHRDLKPSNVLVDAFDQPRVTDFGLAKRLHHDSELTLSGHVLGSPNYMPPEQAAAKRGLVGRRSDVYSLGAILYHLLTGRPPFVGETLTETLHEVLNTEPVSPRLLNPSVPRDLETLCLKCLEKESARRYQTALALAEDLDRFLRQEPIHAHPTGPTERLWRWCRRKPAVASLSAATLLLLLAVTIGSPIAIYRVNQERLRAEGLSKKENQLRVQADRRVYASDMNLVQRALELNNIGSALSVLNRHRPAEKSTSDLRGWEWRYLWGQCQSDAESVFCKPSKPVMSLSVSHDGRWLATGLNETSVAIWDLKTRQIITNLHASGFMVHVAFSPREPLLAFSDVPNYGSSRTNFSVHLWSGSTRQIVHTLPIGAGYCYGIAFSADGQTLVTSARNPQTNFFLGMGYISLWRVADGKKLASFEAPQRGTAVGTPFAANRDLSLAAYAFEDDKVRVIDLATGKQLWEPQKATDDYLTALAFSPDGKLLASGHGASDPVIQLWDVASGKRLGHLAGHHAGIHKLLFFPDGKTLASTGVDQTIRLWDVSDQAQGRALSTLQGHQGQVWALALLPDNTTLVSGSGDRTVCLWNTVAPRKKHKRLTLPVYGLWRFAPDSKSILTLDDDNLAANPRVARWSQETDFQEMQLLFELGTNIVDEACFSRDGRWLATSWAGGVVRVFDVEQRRQSREFIAPAGRAMPREFTPGDKKLIILHADDNSLHEWDLETERESRSWSPPQGRWAYAFSPDGHWCLSSIHNPDAKSVTALIDLTNGSVTNLQTRWFYASSFSPDGRFFAFGGWGSEVRLWETATQKEIAKLSGNLSSVWGLGFSPDGKRLVTGNGGREAVTLWDIESPESHGKLLTLEGGGSFFDTIAFSPDGNVLAASNQRNLVHLWRAPSWAEIEAAEKESRKEGQK